MLTFKWIWCQYNISGRAKSSRLSKDTGLQPIWPNMQVQTVLPLNITFILKTTFFITTKASNILSQITHLTSLEKGMLAQYGTLEFMSL